jgi:hypothetical protein
MERSEVVLIDCLLPLAHSPRVYIHNSTPIFLQLFKPTSISLQVNFLITKTLSC